jgi:uncharacterized membrane protein
MSKFNDDARPQTPVSSLQALVDALEADERLDEVGHKLARVGRPLAEGEVGRALGGAWLGHAPHPMLTDLPIGFFTSSFVLDLVGGRSSRTASQRLIGLGLLSVVPTALTGMTDYVRQSDDPRIRRVGAAHAVGNSLAAFLYLRSWTARRRGHHLIGVLFGLLGAGAATFSGALGGHMAFARAAGTGERGVEETPGTGSSRHDGQHVDLTAEATGELLDIREVADRLGVSTGDVATMVETEVLVPVGGEGTGRFRPTDVEAARMRGG